MRIDKITHWQGIGLIKVTLYLFHEIPKFWTLVRMIKNNQPKKKKQTLSCLLSRFNLKSAYLVLRSLERFSFFVEWQAREIGLKPPSDLAVDSHLLEWLDLLQSVVLVFPNTNQVPLTSSAKQHVVHLYFCFYHSQAHGDQPNFGCDCARTTCI